MQAVPQVAGIVKSAFGTIDSEVLQKAGVSTQQFLKVVLDGLEKLPQVAGGISNAFENLADSTKEALSNIGTAMLPVIKPVVDALSKLATQVGETAKYFQTLPAPAQAAIGALIAVVAVIGPLLLGFGTFVKIGASIAASVAGMASAFGLSSIALLGWAGLIAVAIAALTALGVWIYQHWEPIKAVITQAWDGLSELWGAAWAGVKAVLIAQWGPILAFFSTVWNAIAPYMVKAWTGVAQKLSDVWTGIKDVAFSLWDGIKSKFKAFIDWLKANVPGAKKLLTLGDTFTTEEAKLAAKNKPAAETPRVPTVNGPGLTIANPKQDDFRKYLESLKTANAAAFAEFSNPGATDTAKKLVEYFAKIAEFRKEGVTITQAEIEKGAQQIRGAGFLNDLREKDNKKREETKKAQQAIVDALEKGDRPELRRK